MTTHDHHTEHDMALDPSTAGRPADRYDDPDGQVTAPRYDQNAGYADRSTETVAQPDDERLVRPSDERAGHAADDRVDRQPGDDLFADDQMVGLRARWDSVQAGFVDDPKECVQKADGLVSDLVDQLTSSFAQARSRLEEQWARGEDASTEDLRIALKRYREFFDRLLAV